jgi:hypothetical protein
MATGPKLKFVLSRLLGENPATIVERVAIALRHGTPMDFGASDWELVLTRLRGFASLMHRFQPRSL